MSDYNPYDLVPMIVNGEETVGRPFQFDSEAVDPQMRNAFGEFVKPSKLSTICPGCGGGLEIDVILGDPPFVPVEYDCPECNPDPLPMPDPFVNPLEAGKVSPHELDPLLHDPNKQIVKDESTVADRLSLSETSTEPKEDVKEPSGSAAEVAPVLEKKTQRKRKKKTKGAKKKTDSAERIVPIEPVDGIVGEEVDFDDDDLVESE